MLQISFIVAFMVIFFHACTWETMVFSFVGKTLDKLPDYLKKPLYDCPICMCPWWGSSVVAVGILVNVWKVNSITEVFIIVATAGGINTVLSYIISSGKSIVKALKQENG